ncbi:hypothetical protein I3760_16G112800 [Carya illinoinensis]|nr:hypothetical protein I3760_16G112800 [Carya illinoinensis]
MAAVRGFDGPMLAANRSFAELVSAAPQPFPDVQLPPRVHKTIDGEVYFLFSKEEMLKSAEPFRFSLVLKFLRQRPLLDAIRLFIKSRWGLSGMAVVSAMRRPRNVFVRLTTEEDFNKAFSREACDVNGVVYPSRYLLENLFGLIDNATRCATRTDGTRVCLEVDVAKPPLLSFWIGAPSCPTSRLQEVVYETMPAFFSLCKVQGHNMKTCKKGDLRKEQRKKQVRMEYVPKKLKEVEASGLPVAVQDVAEQCSSDVAVVGRVEPIINMAEQEVEEVQWKELQDQGSEDKVTAGNAEVLCSVSAVMVPVISEVLERPCLDSVEEVPRAVGCSEMAHEYSMVHVQSMTEEPGLDDVMGHAENDAVVQVQCMIEEPGLLPVDVSQEELVSIVVAHAEQVRDFQLVEPSTEKELIGDSNAIMACLSEPEMEGEKNVLHNDVSSDSDIREEVKKQDGHKKLRSSKRVITRASKLNL